MSEGSGATPEGRPSIFLKLLKDPFGKKAENALETALRQKLTVFKTGEEQEIFKAEAERLRVLPEINEVLEIPNGSMQFVHATLDKNTAEQINQKGLHCKRAGLNDVAILLPADKETILQILASRHKGFRFIATVNLPALPDDLQQEINDANRELGMNIKRDALFAKELPEKKEVSTPGYRRLYDSVIDPKFVKGYFDALKGGFVKNPLFKSTLDNEDLTMLEGKLKNLDDPNAFYRFH